MVDKLSKVFLGQQPCQVVKWHVNQRFKNYSHRHHGTVRSLMMRTEVVLETLIYLPFSHQTQLLA
jgi:hypothetical protein